MLALIARGIPSESLATVAIGKRQPIAPNDSEEGRARNRRVEFMISASQEANFRIVRDRHVVADFLRTGRERIAPQPEAKPLELLKFVHAEGSGEKSLELRPATLLELQKPVAAEIRVRRPAEIRVNKPNDDFVLK